MRLRTIAWNSKLTRSREQLSSTDYNSNKGSPYIFLWQNAQRSQSISNKLHRSEIKWYTRYSNKLHYTELIKYSDLLSIYNYLRSSKLKSQFSYNISKSFNETVQLWVKYYLSAISISKLKNRIYHASPSAWTEGVHSRLSLW